VPRKRDRETGKGEKTTEEKRDLAEVTGTERSIGHMAKGGETEGYGISILFYKQYTDEAFRFSISGRHKLDSLYRLSKDGVN
jgi:hypothetical protein